MKVLIFAGLFLLLAASPRVAMSQSHPDFPSAKQSIRDPVPWPLVQQIANAKATRLWGDGALGPGIPLSDLQGDVIAWMFSFSRGGTTFPTYDLLLRQIKAGRNLKNVVDHSSTNEAKRLYKELIGEQKPQATSAAPLAVPTGGPELGQIEAVRPDGSPSKRAQLADIAELRRYAAGKAVGAGQFGTIIVSASYRRVPVPLYFGYLAPYYAHFDQAQEKARTLIGETASLQRIYFLGFRGLFFEFVNEKAVVVLHASTLQPTELRRGVSPQEPSSTTSQASMAAREHIKKLWADIQLETEKH